MAHHVEPMDIDSSVCDFDDKENSLHHNVLPRTPCMEKGYEELDVSELNMKLRYSMTPSASPMSKSFTANCLDNQNNETGDTLDFENGNMTRSLHSTLTKHDTIIKTQNSLPLQARSTDNTQVGDVNRNVLQPLDSTAMAKDLTVTVTGPTGIEDNLSLPSSSSSMAHTPEATTPTKEIPKDGGSPIMRGLKSVFSMFRPSQSPIPLDDEQVKQDTVSPPIVHSPEVSNKTQAASASTPLTAQKTKDPLAKRNSPAKDSLVFNEDLEKELEWKDDSILFGKEKIPISKLFFQIPNQSASKTNTNISKSLDAKPSENMNQSLEYMDISYNDSGLMGGSAVKIPDMNSSEAAATDSDGEFVDAESTIKNESHFDQSNISEENDAISTRESYCGVQQDKLNITTETLSASISNSGDLSTASTETTKVIETVVEKSTDIEEIPNEVTAQEEKKIEEINSSIGKLDFIPSVDNVAPTRNISNNQHNNTVVVQPISAEDDVVKSVDNMNEIVTKDNIEVGLSPSTDNVVISSLSQIPLIADPRVLLFNLSSGLENIEPSDVKGLNTSPADVPLPDDDDMASLPTMNCTLDTISQTLDKISDEIPKINQQAVEEEIMQSATSEAQLLDLTLSILPVSESKESTITESKKVDISLLPVEESVLSTPVTSLDCKRLATIGNEIDNHAKEPVVPSNSVPEEVASKPDVQLDETQAVINAIEELIPAQANLDRESLLTQNVEPLNISIAEVPSAYQSKIDMEIVANDIACILEAGIPIQIDQNVQEYQTEKEPVNEVLSNKINVITELDPQVSFVLQEKEATTFAGVEKRDPLLNGSNVEFIKHELEAIIDKAVDIAMEKIDAGLEIIKKEHTNMIQNDQTKCNEDTIKISTEHLSDNASNVLTAKADLVKACDIHININTASDLSQVPMAPAAAMNIVATCEEPIVDEVRLDCEPLSDVKGNINMDMTPPDMEKIEINIMDKETQNAIDEKVFASKNNSPFVLVCQEQVDAVPLPLENFEVIENTFVTEPKVAALPPTSPAIVSKGYNFNFDEIEDPFATKAKIRTSQPLEESPNRTFQQSDNKNFGLSKKETKNDRRKSQPDRKKPVANKKNSTVAGKTPVKSVAHPQPTVAETIESNVVQFKPEDKLTTNIIASHIKDATNENDNKAEIPCNKNETTTFVKESPYLQQSAYFSAVTSSSEEVVPKDNYDRPDLDNPDINPFATKSRICKSPPPDLSFTSEDPFATKSLIRNSIESSIPHNTEMTAENTNVNVDLMQEMAVSNLTHFKMDATIDKDSVDNSNCTTTSSIKNEKNNSIDTVKTEDEDTIEGPFLEAEEFNNEDKVCEFDNVDMMQFSDLPIGNEATTEAGEMFIDAEAFEFLLNQNQTNTLAHSGRESLFLKFDPLFAKRVSSDNVLSALNRVHKKQSTPKKKERTRLSGDATFDVSPVPGPSSSKGTERPPLIKDSTFDKSPCPGPSTLIDTERPPLTKDATFDKSPCPGSFTPTDTERPPLTKDATFDKSPCPGPSTPIDTDRPPLTIDATFDKSPIPGPPKSNTTHELNVHNATDDSCDDLNVTVSKPMMVVNPAVNAVVTPRNKSLTPVRSNRQSLTFTSPAIAVIDRLLSMSSANNSFMNHDTTVAEVYPDNEADLALTQLRELLADKEISVYNLRTETKELQNRLATMESQMKNLETIGEQRLKKINELNERLDEKNKLNKSMAKVVEEYERTIASLIAETEQDKVKHAEERAQLIRERDEQTAHLASMEISFNDLHSKYEKSKQVILGFKANEDLYKKSIREFEENLTKMQKNYELLKQHATAKLNYANEELQKINRSHESEVLKLSALIKRKELHITSLEETLQQKTKANEELTSICDELINKVG